MKKASMVKRSTVMAGMASLMVLAACGNNAGSDNNDAANAANNNGNNASGNGESVEMTAATINPSESLLAQTLSAFAEEIEAESNGEITFDVHTGGTVGNASSLYQSVISGDIDMVYSDTGWFAEHNPEFDILSTNYLFEDQEHFESIVNEEGALQYFEDLLIDNPGLRTVMYAGGLERNIISAFPIESAEDLEGRQMRSGGSSAEMEWWQSLGANPTTIDFNEVYSALQTGVAEGSQNSLDAMIEQRFGEVADYVARTQHNLTLGFIVMNNERYETLSEEHQEAIQRAADNIQEEYISRAFDQADESMQELIEEFGVEFTDPERDELIEISRGQMEELAEEYGVLDTVQEIFER